MRIRKNLRSKQAHWIKSNGNYARYLSGVSIYHRIVDRLRFDHGPSPKHVTRSARVGRRDTRSRIPSPGAAPQRTYPTKRGGVRFYYGQVGFGLRWRELLIKKWVILLRIFRVKLDGLIFIAQKTIIRGAAQCKPHANVRGSCRARS